MDNILKGVSLEKCRMWGKEGSFVWSGWQQCIGKYSDDTQQEAEHMILYLKHKSIMHMQYIRTLYMHAVSWRGRRTSSDDCYNRSMGLVPLLPTQQQLSQHLLWHSYVLWSWVSAPEFQVAHTWLCYVLHSGSHIITIFVLALLPAAAYKMPFFFHVLHSSQLPPVVAVQFFFCE